VSQATPIVFIHGLFPVPFTPDGPRLLAPNPVLAPDLPGYGEEAGRDPREISLDRAADEIYARMRAAGCITAHLVGHSVGGAIAVVLADRYPEAVASVVSVEGNFTLRDAFWSQELARMDPTEAEAMLAGYRAGPRAWLAGSGFDATPEQEAIAARILAAQPASTLQAMARSVVRVTGDAAYLRAIATILDRSIPLHLVAGERSRAARDVPDWALQRAASTTIQPGVGHMMMLEDQPAFLSIIRRLIPFGAPSFAKTHG